MSSSKAAEPPPCFLLPRPRPSPAESSSSVAGVGSTGGYAERPGGRKKKKKPRFWLEFDIFSDGSRGPSSTSSSSTTPPAAPASQDTTTTTTISPTTTTTTATAAATTAPLTCFHLFAHLPPELRLKIWAASIQPRILAVSCVSRRTAERRRADRRARCAENLARGSAAAAPRDHNPMIPVLLHVSREARRVALEHYELAFAWKVPHMLEFGEFDDDDCSESDEDDHGEGSLDDEDSDESGGATSWKSASSSAEGSASSSSSGHSNGSKSALTATSKSKRGPKDRRVWFNFSLDALYLLGDLEPSDGYGVAAPLSYFLSRSDTWRVRRVALSFTELCIGELEADQVFVVLYHVVDRFPLAITTTTSTKTTAARTRRRSHRPLLVAARHDVDVEARRFWDDMPCCHDNVVQKVWRGWASGTTGETPRDATREIWLVKEGQLDELVRRGDDEDDDFETENAAGCEARNGLGTAPSAGC